MSLPKQTILVVEDQPLVRMALSDALGDAGFQTIEAEDAETGYRLAEEVGGVPLIITDVRLAGPLSGFGLAVKIGQSHPDTRIIIMSGSEPPAGGMPEGAIFLPKPVTRATLLRAVEKSLAGRSPSSPTAAPLHR